MARFGRSLVYSGRGLGSPCKVNFDRRKGALREVMSDTDIRRMQIFVKVDNTRALRFAKALHFEVECILRKFCPEGADYYMMVRFD